MKTKFVIYLSVFLSMCSFTLACGVNEPTGTTLAAAETATTTPPKNPAIVQELRDEQRQENVRIYLEAVHAAKEAEAKAAREAAVVAQEARKAELRASRAARARTAIANPVASEPGDGSCGGDLPPCWVLRRENRYRDPRLWNGGCYAPIGWTGRGPCGSTASGIWQITRQTWGSKLVNGAWVPGFGGYMNAADAPPDVQDQKARLLWAGGKGCSHWSAC